MFDLFTGKVQHVPSTPAISILISTSVQGTALAAAVLASLLVATRELPNVPDVMAFVAEVPAIAPPPPPPPAPAPSQPRVASPAAAPVSPMAAPIEAPAQIAPEAPSAASIDVGVPGGVEGGIAGGIVGGIVGSIAGILESPPPPPVSHEPVRIGGQVQAPALVKRVEPIYPMIAQHASIDGIVILDAIVDEHGRVTSLKVLRGHPLLAKAAKEAVEQGV